MKLVSEEKDSNKRLDVFLSEHLDASRSEIKKHIRQGVYVNGKPAKLSHIISNKDTIEFEDSLLVKEKNSVIKEDDSIVPQPHDLAVIYEDNDLLVINKERGVSVHPGVDQIDNTVANYVKYYLMHKNQFDFNVSRAGLVHRIDKPAGGVLVFAKNATAQKELMELYASKKVKKIYLAKVERIGGNKAFVNIEQNKKIQVNGYIYRDENNRMRRMFSPVVQSRGGGRNCESDFFFTDPETCYVLIHTGRTHQIRATLKYLGYAIVGDSLYSSNNKVKDVISLWCVFQAFVFHEKAYNFSIEGYNSTIML